MFCSALLSILFKLCAYIIVVFMLLCLAICCTSCKGVPPIKLNVIAVCLKLCVVIFSLVIPMFSYDFFIISLMDLVLSLCPFVLSDKLVNKGSLSDLIVRVPKYSLIAFNVS